MARFTDLAVELQLAIWKLVFPARGGVHWIQIEGVPHHPQAVQESLHRLETFYHGTEPEDLRSQLTARSQSAEYEAWWREQEARPDYNEPDYRADFFQSLYPIVPSVWGQARIQARNQETRLAADDAIPGGEEVDAAAARLEAEIAYTRRCRQLSTYTQVATLLQTCRTSRMAAQDYLGSMPVGTWPLYRGLGPRARPRPFETWRRQYGNLSEVDSDALPQTQFPLAKRSSTGHRELIIKPAAFMGPAEVIAGPAEVTVPAETVGPATLLVPRLSAVLDLVVLRLHTAAGHSTPLLNHVFGQMLPYNPEKMYGHGLPLFLRIGLEWNPSWEPPEGEPWLEPNSFSKLNKMLGLFGGDLYTRDFQLYWLVDGIPRPQWDQYPPIIPETMNRLIKQYNHRLFGIWGLEPEIQSQLVAHQDLYQEFEANGRRYYVVFVIGRPWIYVNGVGENYKGILPDSTLDWKGIFPGGQDLWPKALHAPAKGIFSHRADFRGGPNGNLTYILSWEPI